ncbi:MAG: response regulator transcription factor [Nodosilinea sp.]
MKRVIVISPSIIAQAGLATLIAEESDQWEVTSAGPDAPLAGLLATAEADCALVNLPLLGTWPMEFLPPVGDSTLPLVVLMDSWADTALPELIQAGILGLLPGQVAGAEIVAALEAASLGLITIHPAIVPALLALHGPGQTTEGLDLPTALTPREVEVLTRLAEGLSNKAIAHQLHLSEHTVKYHTSALFAKLGVSSRTEAVMVGARAGLILI